MSILPRLPTYIGREDEKRLLRTYTRQIMEQPYCRALYFQAGGGLGKTHLLLHYPGIIADDGEQVTTRLRIARLVDFYNFESRNPTVIEQRLIDGLKQTEQQEWYRLPAPQVDAAFADYAAALQEYRRIREISDSQAQITQAQERLRQQFVLSWNSLTPQYALVMSFDTLETLFSEPAPPAEALVNVGTVLSGVDLVLAWMQTTLPRLQHTLVLLSGRPVDNNRIITTLQASGILVEDVQQLDFLTDRTVIKTYIETYTSDQTLTADEIDRIERITEGRPLLLTCYAETRRSEVAIPPGLPGFGRLDSRPEFEDWLIETILNPLRRPMPLNLAQTTLAYALYFLVYARRGLRRGALADLFAQLKLNYDRRVLDHLDEVALVKCIDDKFFLHDEIFVMIDQSGKPDECGLREPTLDYLCRISSEQVQRVERSALLGAMADNMYYELSRDFVQGYRTYVIYADLLLEDRSINDVLVLSDAFWSTLNYYVSRGQERVYPYRNGLEQSTLTETQILEDEQVKQVQLLLAQHRNQAAFEKAEQLHQSHVQAGTLPPDTHDPAAWPWRTPQHDPYLFVSLNLWRAYALHLAQQSIGSSQAEHIFSRIITFLEQLDDHTVDDEFLHLRRPYFLSQAYVRRGYIYRQQQHYTQAQADYERARMAARSYQERRMLPADQLSLKSNLAHITNNLAYALALTGNLKRALTFSNEVIKEYLPVASTYQRALYWNTNALIRMRRGEFVEAEVPLHHAEQAAQESESQRARALVLQARGLLKSAIMNARQEVDEQIQQHFEQAVQLVKDEPDTLREIYYDWAGYARVIAVLYQRKGEQEKCHHYQQAALRLFDQALNEVPDTHSMQFADLIVGKATVYNDMQDYAQAQTLLDQAEQVMYEPMPEYAQVVSGKIALQRAVIMLDQQHNDLEALKLMTLAMARAFVFARLHLDQGNFERLIDERISQMNLESLQTFYAHIQANQFSITVADLPYQKPDPGKWSDAWATSVAFMRESIETRLDV